MNSSLAKFTRCGFAYWILAAALALYFYVSFDFKKFSNSNGNFLTKVATASSFKNLNLGIDLQGGTRLVLNVDLDKAFENKLADFGKNIEKLIKKKKLGQVLERSLSSQSFFIKLDSDQSTLNSYQEIAENYPELEVKQEDGQQIKIMLSYKEKININNSAVEKAVEILRNRLDTLDVKGLSVNRHGDSKIVVQLPGMDNMFDIEDSIMRAARLEFRLVYDSASSQDSMLNRYDGFLPSDKVMMKDRSGSVFLVSLFPDMGGSRIKDARYSSGELGQSQVAFSLDSTGAKEFSELTRESIGKRLAIIMDERVISAPTIKSEIGSQGNITGMNQKEALKIAALLRSGALDAPLKIESKTFVGASLGKDSIAQGFFACMIALLMLFVFSILYYKLSGLFAIFALFYNLLVLLLMLAWFKATLTLPGIAGIVLTVGMAIDASILIFERIKEELAENSAFSDALAKGFDGAMVVILDSNITTFLAGIILFWAGGPAVRGFAVTLMLGVISTIISGVFFLRSFFKFFVNFLGFKKVSI